MTPSHHPTTPKFFMNIFNTICIKNAEICVSYNPAVQNLFKKKLEQGLHCLTFVNMFQIHQQAVKHTHLNFTICMVRN